MKISNILSILPTIFLAGAMLVGCNGVTVETVKRTTDQTQLAKFVLEAEDWDVRETAMDKLTDQPLLGKIATEADHYFFRKAAVAKLTDQSLLATIAVEDLSSEVREAAVAKLTDQSLLAKIALDFEELSTRETAMKKLTDQPLLAKIAMEADPYSFRKAAVAKLNDQSLLVKIAIEAKELGIRSAAIAKLAAADQSTFSNATVEERRTASIVLRVAAAFASIPPKHRHRLIEHVLPSVEVLCDPDVIDHVGEIVSLQAAWKSISRLYTLGNISGEEFTFSIVLANLTPSVEQKWTTHFPNESGSNVGFLSARIRTVHLLGHVFDELPQSLLARIAVNDRHWSVREAAVAKLADQSLLEKIAVTDQNQDVRKAAKKRLAK